MIRAEVIRMKRIIAVIICSLMIFSAAACAGEKKDERADREIKLTQPSEESIQISEPEEESEEEKDLTKDFTPIARLKELPEYMKTNPQLYADMLENMLKLYYTAILTGRANSENYKHRYSGDELPSENATAQKRRDIAEYCTVGGALEYFGYDDKNYMKYYEMYNGCLPFFCFDRDANVYIREGMLADNILPMTGYVYSLYFIFRYSNIDKIEREALSFAAAEINRAVNDYYYGIKNGTVTASKKLKYTSDKLPEKSADQSERDKCAREATIQGALDYYGCYTPLYPCVTELGYNKKSQIFTLPDFNDPEMISISSPETKLSVLYG